MSISEMRERKRGGWLPREVSNPAYQAILQFTEHETYRFWAVHTEQSGLFMIRFLARFYMPFWFLFVALHIMNGTVTITTSEILVSTPIYIMFALTWRLEKLEFKLKRWPLLVGATVQVCGGFFAVMFTVAVALCMPTELMQHRIFLTCFFYFLVCYAVFFYVPQQVFLCVTCPIFFIGWFSFHKLAGFMTLPCMIGGPVTIISAAWLQSIHDERLRHAFEAQDALLKERHLLQKMQKSLQGILSSIFDASCTCDINGQTLECSPQLQDILGCSPSDHRVGCSGLNLCSSTASHEDCQRLQSFLKSALGSARHQAAKIQCSFHRKLGGVVEACLHAIVLPSVSSSGDHHDVLFVALQTQSIDGDLCKHVSEQEARSAKQELMRDDPPDMPDSKALIEGSGRLHANAWPRELCSSGSAADNVDLSVLDSLSISESMQSSCRHTHLQLVRNVETQTAVSACTADAEVQTLASMARPPLRPPARHSEAASAAAGASQDHSKRKRGRGSCGTRQLVMPCFRATSHSVMQHAILECALSINPSCVPWCCRKHTVLRFLRQEIALMLKSTNCVDLSIERLEQCQNCLCIQLEHDSGEEPECDNCGCTNLLGQNGSEESQASGAAADNEL